MIAWFAFALALLELAFLAGVALLVRRLWRQVAPTVEPYLAMLRPAASTSSSLPHEAGPEPGSPPPAGSSS